MFDADAKDIKQAGRVADFMMGLSVQYYERWDKVKPDCIPFGDLAYGSALMDWYKNGCPKDAAFSYAIGETPCPYLLEFRKEISKEFGLEILTTEEGEARIKALKRVMITNVHDWGPN